MDNLKKRRFILVGIAAIIIVVVTILIIAIVKSNKASSYTDDIEKGRMARSEKKYDQAIGSFEEAINENPQKLDAYLELAELYKEIGDIDGINKILEKAEKEINDKKVFEDLKAQIDLIKGAHETSDDYQNRINLSYQYIQKMDIDNAIRTLLEAIELNPQKPDAYLNLAELYLSIGDPQKAIEILERAEIEIENSDDREKINNKKKEIEEIKSTYDVMLEKVREIKNNSENNEVIDAYEKCIAFDPARKEAYEELSDFYKKTDQPEKAQEILDREDKELKHILQNINAEKHTQTDNQKGTQTDDEYDKSIGIYQEYIRKSDYDNAIITLDDLIKKYPKRTYPYYRIIYIYYHLGRYDMAIKYLDELEKNAQNHTDKMKVARLKKWIAEKQSGKDNAGADDHSLIPEITPIPAQNKITKDTFIGEKGDKIFYGSYEQDNDFSNGAEPIEWIILSKDDSGMLLLSKYALDCMPYNSDEKAVTWENCTLREWLNDTFYNAAFNDEERLWIKKSLLSNPDNDKFGTEGGKATEDKVFLLSLDDSINAGYGFYSAFLENDGYYAYSAEDGAYNKYVNRDSYEDYPDGILFRRCAATPYANSREIWTSEEYFWTDEFEEELFNEMFYDVTTKDGEYTCTWWLRSPGYTSFENFDDSTYVALSEFAAYVEIDGSVDEVGENVEMDDIGVRPVIYITFEPEKSEYVEIDNHGQVEVWNDNAEYEVTQIFERINVQSVGDTITFGVYEQDNDLSNGMEPIEWRVLGKDDNGILLLSEYAIDSKPYNDVLCDITWEDCTLRKWLNNDFYNQAFNDDEKKLINEVVIHNLTNPDCYDPQPEESDTEDKVFLLSYEDITKYGFSSSLEDRDVKRRCACTKYVESLGVFTSYYSVDPVSIVDSRPHTSKGNYSCIWWLRSHGSYSKNAKVVEPEGWIYEARVNTCPTPVFELEPEGVCVRPALYIRLE